MILRHADCTYFVSMRRIFFQFLFPFFISLLFSFSPLASENSSFRSLKIWDQQVTYQVELKNDPRGFSDGESFQKKSKGYSTYHVVLNRALIRKEAEQLFQQFEAVPKNPFTKNHFNFPEWNRFEQDLLSSQDSRFKVKDPRIKNTLQALKEELEYLAWFRVYEKSVKESGSRAEALEKFLQYFSLIRDKTVEYHEVAHLIDLMKVNSQESYSAEFEKYTELNAFYTELAYGENPYDTMAHAVVGLLDEIDQAKLKDYSIEKVSTLLRFLKECPRFAKFFSPSHRMAPRMTLCCFEVLAKITSKDFIFVGSALYRKNLNNLRQNLASLPDKDHRLSS